jgi:hypothetical protein
MSQSSDGCEVLVDRVGRQRTRFQMDTVANYHNAIESQARFRTVPGNELLQGVFIDAPRIRGCKAIQYSQFGVIEVGKTQDNAAVVRFNFLATHGWTASGAVAMGFNRF